MTDAERIQRAKSGDRAAFDALASACLPTLRGVIRRMLGDPADTDDVAQETLLRAYEKIGTFRGDSSFSTWLVSIGTRLALNHLRARKRWRWDAQVHIARHLHGEPARKIELMSLFQSPEHRFDAREHIAFCFTCVGRSLEPDEQAALILRDVLAYKNREAGKILGITESVLRHRLAAARATMQRRFDALCGIVNKQGICYQCEGLRNTTPEARRGPPVSTLGDSGDSSETRFRVRLQVIRDVDIDNGHTQGLHDHVWRAISKYESARAKT